MYIRTLYTSHIIFVLLTYVFIFPVLRICKINLRMCVIMHTLIDEKSQNGRIG